MKKARTAYFVFSEENRALAREDLLRERGEGAKISVAEVAKELGQRWQQLTQAEKDAFKQKAQHQHAAAMQAEAHAAAQDGAAEGEEQQQQQQHGGGEGVAEQAGGKADKESTPLDGLLAASVIRRVMQADEDMARISADGAVAVAMAADALLGMVARLTAGSARGQKRRTLMLKDFAQAIKQDRRLAQAGLRDVEAAVTAVTEAEAAAKSQAKEGSSVAIEDRLLDCPAPQAAEVVAAAKEADKEAVAEARAEADDGEAGARAEGDAMEEGEEAGRENEAPQGQGAQGETEGMQGGGGADAAKGDGKKGGGRGRKKKASGGEGGEGDAAGKKPNAAESKKQKLAKAAEGARKIDTFFTKAS